MSDVKLIWVTPEAEKHIAYCARVSSTNQDNPEYSKLIRYLIDHKHWSPLEMAHMCIEITTSRAISAQLIRHKSFSFQEHSSRYSKVNSNEIYEARRQDLKNKQNSINDLPEDIKDWFDDTQQELIQYTRNKYEQALEKGVAKEQARFLLLQSATTKLYMVGSIRSWVHYVDVRSDKSTQLEHRDIAEKVKTILFDTVPNVAEAMNWS